MLTCTRLSLPNYSKLQKARTKMTNQPEPTFREIVREIQAQAERLADTPDDQIKIISKAQAIAWLNKDERTIDILAIVKRRIIRKAAQ